MTDLSKEPWYHGRVSRVDAEKILDTFGAVEGSYLVRDSLTMTGEYVLSLCHQVCAAGREDREGVRGWMRMGRVGQRKDEEREDGVGGRGERGRRGWWGREREGQRRMEGE